MKAGKFISLLALPTFLLSLSSHAMDIKTFKVTDFQFARCVRTEGEYAKSIKFQGSFSDFSAMAEKQTHDREEHRQPLVDALKINGMKARFELQGIYQEQSLLIEFSLQLNDDSSIQLDDLKVFNAKNVTAQQIAFSMLPRAEQLLIAERSAINIDKFSKAPLIRPYFNSYFEFGHLKQNDAISSGDNVECLDLIEIALAMIR